MAKDKLTAKQVEYATDGTHNDGAGLNLRIKGNSRKWVFRYTRFGKVTELGLGSAAMVSLKLARQLRDQYYEALTKGLDPRDEKRKREVEHQASQRKRAIERHIVGREQLPEQSGPFHLYRHYGFGGELLYVGESRNAIMRWRDHKYAKSEWVDLVAVITVDHYPTRRDAKVAEAIAITAEKPRFNRSVMVGAGPVVEGQDYSPRVKRRSCRRVWPVVEAV